jgi:hypothetical protein
MSRRPLKHSGRRRPQNDAFPWGWASLGALVLIGIIGGVGWLYTSATAQHIALGEDLCPKSGPTEQTLVLVDVTDTISATTRTDLLNHLKQVAAGIARGGLFELRALTPGENNSQKLFSYCNPGNGAELDSLTGNPAKAKKRWDEGFMQPLEHALEQSLHIGEANSSPLMAAIQEITLEHLNTKDRQSIPTKIYIASDMLEHTADFSIYGKKPDFAAWKVSAGQMKYATDLHGADVELWIVKRDTYAHSASLAEFWAQWVMNNRGRFVRATSMQGGQ